MSSAAGHAAPPLPSERVILVLGMHRSGTSAVAGALGESGVALGERLIDAAPDNPQGYFENTDAVLANERLLDALDRAWDDVRALPDGWMETAAAADAARAVRDEVVPPFAGSPLWALKDPRMCRTLPLWTREFARGGIEPLGLLVARHPDEVAASLRTRDGMHPHAARLLWMRHVIDAARAAPDISAVVRYEALLAEPVHEMRAALESLGLSLTLNEDRLRGFLVRDARHHHAQAGEPADDLHALSLEMYEALGVPGWRERLHHLGERLDAIDVAAGGWIEALGMAARGADRRRRDATARVIEAERRADVLQAALDNANELAERHVRDLAQVGRESRATSEGLERAEALARERVAEAERLAAELASTQQAKSEAELLVAGATEEARLASAELRRTQEALRRAEEHSSRHLADVARVTGELAATADALRAAEDLVQQRLLESDATRGELERTQDALRDAEALVAARTTEAAMLSRALGITQGALSNAESLVDARAEEAAALAAQLAKTQQALSDAEALVEARTDEAGRVEAQLARTQQALSTAEALVEARTDEAGRVETQLARTQQALADAEVLVEARVSEAAATAAELVRTQEALAGVESLAVKRLDEIERLSRHHDAQVEARRAVEAQVERLDTQLAQVQDALDETAARRRALEDTLARIRAARMWPAFARVSGLPRDAGA